MALTLVLALTLALALVLTLSSALALALVALRWLWDLALALALVVLVFECGFGIGIGISFCHFDVWKMIKRTMKIEIPQIKRCKLEQFDDDDTISISAISVFKFVSMLSELRFFSFEIVSLCNPVSIVILFSSFVF